MYTDNYVTLVSARIQIRKLVVLSTLFSAGGHRPNIEAIMTSSFDYSSFKTEYVIQNNLRELCDAIRATQNPQGQPLFPDAAADAQANPLQALVARLNLNEGVDADPVFDFECNGMTVREWGDACANHVNAAGAAAPRNLMDWMQSRGSRLYYVSAGEPNGNNVQWTELTRPESSDAAYENAELIFLDPHCTIVDWRSSLANLKRLARDRRYTFLMMRTALLRIISRLMPEQIQLLQEKTANEIAVFLLKLDGRIDKLTLYRQQLLVFHRKANEDLTSAMARLENLVDKMHPVAQADNLPLRDQIFRTALISLTPDSIACPLIEDIRKASLDCIPLALPEIRRIVLAAERRANVVLTSPLTFGRSVNNQPLASQIQLNSMQCDYFRKKLPYDFYGEEVYQSTHQYRPVIYQNPLHQMQGGQGNQQQPPPRIPQQQPAVRQPQPPPREQQQPLRPVWRAPPVSNPPPNLGYELDMDQRLREELARRTANSAAASQAANASDQDRNPRSFAEADRIRRSRMNEHVERDREQARLQKIAENASRAEAVWKSRNANLFAQLRESNQPNTLDPLSGHSATAQNLQEPGNQMFQTYEGHEHEIKDENDKEHYQDASDRTIDMSVDDPDLLLHASESFFQNVLPEHPKNPSWSSHPMPEGQTRPTQHQAAAVQSTPGIGLVNVPYAANTSPLGDPRPRNISGGRGRSGQRFSDPPYNPPSYLRRPASAGATLLHEMETRSKSRDNKEESNSL
uniref:hypothetical protein n=1 Tax=Polynucleobacter sp. TaxID=2029855 RepID=UPI00334156A9